MREFTVVVELKVTADDQEQAKHLVREELIEGWQNGQVRFSNITAIL